MKIVRSPTPRQCFICREVIVGSPLVLDRLARGGGFVPNEAHWRCFLHWDGRRAYAESVVNREVSRVACDLGEAVAYRDAEAIALVGRSSPQVRIVDANHGVWADFPLENWRTSEPLRSMFSCDDAMAVVIATRERIKSRIQDGQDLVELCDWKAKERMSRELAEADEVTREHVALYERSMVQALEAGIVCPHCRAMSTGHRIVRQVNWTYPCFTPDAVDGRPTLRTFVERKRPYFACIKCGGSFELAAIR